MSSSDVASLESALTCWTRVEYASAAVVLIGVIGEYVNDFTHWFRALRRHRRLGKGSTLLLIAGLAVELLGLVKTATLSNHIIEAERSARVQLQKSIAPRDLTPEKWKASVAALRAAGHISVHVRIAIPDGESVRLYAQLKRLFDEAEWTPYATAGLGSDELVVGVLISDRSTNRSAADALLAVLTDNDLDPRSTTLPPLPLLSSGFAGIPGMDLEMLIGVKPFPQ
jgi:hypothetical protein